MRLKSIQKMESDFIIKLGTSLVAQLLRIHLLVQGTQV